MTGRLTVIVMLGRLRRALGISEEVEILAARMTEDFGAFGLLLGNDVFPDCAPGQTPMAGELDEDGTVHVSRGYPGAVSIPPAKRTVLLREGGDWTDAGASVLDVPSCCRDGAGVRWASRHAAR